MDIAKGNIQSCPHMDTKASIDCLLAINAPPDKVVGGDGLHDEEVGNIHGRAR